MIKRITSNAKEDGVLTLSFLLAIGTMFIIPPNFNYFSYIDFHTLILLFCLMLIVEGIRQQQFFDYLGNYLITQTKNTRGIILILVFLTFISSMLITNDVALIIFVPFGLLIVERIGMRTLIPLVITLMTIAGNLGSMFTPIGNPQNLYLFAQSQLKLLEFLQLMLPYTLAAAILLVMLIYGRIKNNTIDLANTEEIMLKRTQLIFYFGLFLTCLLAVSGIIPHYVVLVLVSVSILGNNRRLFKQIDYSLLFTFVFLFIFIGNIKQVDVVQAFFEKSVAHHEVSASIFASQLISNVPAALLLSSYTENIKGLIIGTNLGGLGTLIASMASLISYKLVIKQYPEWRKKYLFVFAFYNIVFLIFLWLIFTVYQ
ncbi:citrate transporter [Enterococcus mundtii]|uniref:Anion transporter n=1 Tax=Enterococcus mundtii TaxID=53346 RepID=A0ABQ0VC15_ENTMU|nr:SLC13 family permease [Enterococcus mundtii]GEN17655.1 anion transporter [Ligilactobacillus acidipiscis]AUB51908.1 citrate transporter [Enterococcus mundtii]MDB7088515.1 SLC13 family permease [Enterococcus mundtii]MZZ60262.1 citrate transporter [Enterococcus mundtii]MZZ63244.1 citrate transporter [Enterococcus mundtii]